MNKPLVIGITGPSGAGKSVVVQALLHIPTVRAIDMDQLSREVTQIGSPTLQKLVEAFSDSILQEDGSLDRRRLATLAFSDSQSTAILNSITHPAIWKETEKRLATHSRDPLVQAVLLDAPLLLESGMDRICDRVIVVIAPEKTRLSRIVKRDDLTPEQAQLRFKRQQPDAFYTDKADLVVHNIGDATALPALLQRVCQQAKEWIDHD